MFLIEKEDDHEKTIYRRTNHPGFERGRSEQVTHILDNIAAFRSYPVAVRTGQGPEITGKALDQWAYQHENDTSG